MFLSNQEQYAELWKKESENLESHGTYRELAGLTPSGSVLEVGCGTGFGTLHLSKDRDVLSLDSNQLLIDSARALLAREGLEAHIHKCDFFSLTDEDKAIIKNFNPTTIVGWFIGGHGEDIFKYTEEEPDPITKSKLYREKIEDIIVSSDLCVDSVEYIHLASRGARIVGFTENDYIKASKEDYDTYVFKDAGFEVVEVKYLEWSRDGSEFQYGQAHNPNAAQGEAIPTITSILAKRIK